MNQFVFLLLTFFVIISTAFSIQNDAVNNNQQYDIYDGKPAQIISGVSRQSIMFRSPNKSAISFSAILAYGSQISDSLKSCAIINGDNGSFVGGLYDFIRQNINTISYKFSVTVDCTAGNATNVIFVAQASSDLAFLDRYAVYDKAIPTQAVQGKTTAIGFSVLTTELEAVTVVSAQFTAGTQFFYGLGTPDVVPINIINSTTLFPYTLPTRQLVTTFYFNGANVKFDIRGGYVGQICSGLTTIYQRDTNSYKFPSLGNYFSFNGETFNCEFRFVPTNLLYMPRIEMNGVITNNAFVNVRTDDGYGITYSANTTQTAGDGDYRGSTLSDVYYLPTAGYLSLSGAKASGNIAFSVTFVQSSDNRSISYVPVVSTSKVPMETVSQYQYYMATSNAGAIEMSINIAPSRIPLAAYDNCFLNILNDRNLTDVPYARYSLRRFTQMSKPVHFQNAIIRCESQINMYGTLLQRVNSVTQYDQTDFDMVRMGVSTQTRYYVPPSNTTGLRYITILVGDTNFFCVLNVISSTQDTSVKIRLGGESAPVAQTVYSKDLPMPVKSSMVTYELTPFVQFIEVSLTSSGATIMLNSVLVMIVGYFLH